MVCVEFCRGIIVVIGGEGENIVVVVIVVDRIMISSFKNSILAICWVVGGG